MGDVKKAPDQVVKILNIFIIWTGSLIHHQNILYHRKSLVLFGSGSLSRKGEANFPLWEII